MTGIYNLKEERLKLAHSVRRFSTWLEGCKAEGNVMAEGKGGAKLFSS